MKFTAAGVITTTVLQVLQLEWSGAGTAGDNLTLLDNSGRIVWQATATGAQYDFFKNFGKPVSVNGLNLTAITSGTLTIFYV